MATTAVDLKEKGPVPSSGTSSETLRTLPGDDVRAILWRYADRYDIQMLVQSTRAVARGPVARLVAQGARSHHEWTAEKNDLLKVYDESGITAVFMEPEQGGFIAGPKNLALALVAFELAWVDAGAATGALASNLGLSPIHERGTPAQQAHYMALAAPPKPGEDRKPTRAAFALTEPIPYVGVDTGMLSGKVRVARWEKGKEPVLKVEKRGRFITNMGFANLVTAAVDSGDERIKGSCMVILEESDPGTFDRGTPTKKMVHQLSSTSDPIFNLEVPASRIIGGYTVKGGIIVPNFDHSEIIEAVFKRTRVTVALMTSAKLLSAVEPIIRYQRGRFRGAEQVKPGSLRYELGIQQREDALHRLIDVWAMGEAGAALGFHTARIYDLVDPLEKRKDEILTQKGVSAGRAQFRFFKDLSKSAFEFLELDAMSPGQRDEARWQALKNDELVQFILLDAVANVVCPAAKLWNTGQGANTMREAVSLMGGYGITEDCPGFIGQKWMDAQLEATYEGPEAVQRRHLSVTMTNELFQAQLKQWITELRHIASERSGTGAGTLASALRLWSWTYEHLLEAKDAYGQKLYQGPRQGVTFPLVDALCWLLAARSQILDVLELEKKGLENPVVAEGLAGTLQFYTDLCHVQAARAAGEVGRICAELVYGYNRHPDEAGPCPAYEGLPDFAALRMKVDGCLTGSRLAKERAAEALSKVMIPEALDYPQ